MHEHYVCEHDIKYCKICDVCYCDKCKKQWFNYTITYTPGSYITYGDSTVPTVFENHIHGKDLE